MPAEAPASRPIASVLRASGVVGVLRAADAASAVQAALAAVRGGLRAIELTFTTPGMTDALRELQARLGPDVALGAGTVLSAGQAREALEAGAQFLVSPHLGEDVLEVALEAGVPYLPGVLTPTEIVRAQGLGAGMLKVFPAGSSGGAAYLKDLLGPFPGLQVMVTGGITPAEVPTYLGAGALAVGLGSNLFPGEALRAGNWAAVEGATREALAQAEGPA